MPILGSHPRYNTLKGYYGPDNLVLVAYGKAKAFNKKSHLWSGDDNFKMNKKACEEGLNVRVFMGSDSSSIEEYNDGYLLGNICYDICVVIDGWNSDIHGLVYPDGMFEKEINRILKEFNIPGKIDYTEQGMQGDNFVSMVGDKSTLEWLAKTYGKKLGFDVEARTSFFAMCDKDIDRVVDTLKSLNVGARVIKNEGNYVAAQLTYSKPISDVVKGLIDAGWRRLGNERKKYIAKMFKDNMEVRITTRGVDMGPRIYIDGSWG